jgi:hypothetical protein
VQNVRGDSSALLGTKTLQEATEVWSVDAVAIPQEIRGCGLVGKGLSDLLPGPGGGRMVGHIHMPDAAAVVGEDDEDEHDAKVAVGTVKKSIDAHCGRCVRRNVRQVGEGDAGRRPRYLATVVSAISMPNFWSSPCRREAPQSGFARCIFRIRGDVACDGRATKLGLRGTPAPLPGEEATVPRDDGGGFHDLHRPSPAAPHSREQHPQQSVGPTEPEPPWCSLLKDGQLVAERQDLGLEFNGAICTDILHSPARVLLIQESAECPWGQLAKFSHQTRFKTLSS